MAQSTYLSKIPQEAIENLARVIQRNACLEPFVPVRLDLDDAYRASTELLAELYRPESFHGVDRYHLRFWLMPGDSDFGTDDTVYVSLWTGRSWLRVDEVCLGVRCPHPVFGPPAEQIAV